MIVSISPYAIERRYQSDNGGHWFDADTLRFFRSRISQGFTTKYENVFFVSSEKPPHGPRAYSVRMLRAGTGKIDTIGEFCAYRTRSQAMTEARKLAATEATSGPRCSRYLCSVPASKFENTKHEPTGHWTCGNHEGSA